MLCFFYIIFFWLVFFVFMKNELVVIVTFQIRGVELKYTVGQNLKLGQSLGPALIFFGKHPPPDATVNLFIWTQTGFLWVLS